MFRDECTSRRRTRRSTRRVPAPPGSGCGRTSPRGSGPARPARRPPAPRGRPAPPWRWTARCSATQCRIAAVSFRQSIAVDVRKSPPRNSGTKTKGSRSVWSPLVEDRVQRPGVPRAAAGFPTRFQALSSGRRSSRNRCAALARHPHRSRSAGIPDPAVRRQSPARATRPRRWRRVPARIDCLCRLGPEPVRPAGPGSRSPRAAAAGRPRAGRARPRSRSSELGILLAWTRRIPAWSRRYCSLHVHVSFRCAADAPKTSDVVVRAAVVSRDSSGSGSWHWNSNTLGAQMEHRSASRCPQKVRRSFTRSADEHQAIQAGRGDGDDRDRPGAPRRTWCTAVQRRRRMIFLAFHDAASRLRPRHRLVHVQEWCVHQEAGAGPARRRTSRRAGLGRPWSAARRRGGRRSRPGWWGPGGVSLRVSVVGPPAEGLPSSPGPVDPLAERSGSGQLPEALRGGHLVDPLQVGYSAALEGDPEIDKPSLDGSIGRGGWVIHIAGLFQFSGQLSPTCLA